MLFYFFSGKNIIFFWYNFVALQHKTLLHH